MALKKSQIQDLRTDSLKPISPLPPLKRGGKFKVPLKKGDARGILEVSPEIVKFTFFASLLIVNRKFKIG